MKTNKFIKLIESYGFTEVNKGTNSKHRKYVSERYGTLNLSHSAMTKEVHDGVVRNFKKQIQKGDA